MSLTTLLHRLVALVVQPASAHCDTPDGPVVTAGRRALATGNVNHALAWVHEAATGEVSAAFTQVVAALGPARIAAERHFLETLVRLHRASEGAEFDGIKPAGTPQPPAVTAADLALVSGSLAPLAGLVDDERWPRLAALFDVALALRTHDVDDLASARQYVAAYVQLVHHAAGHEHGPEERAHEHVPAHSH